MRARLHVQSIEVAQPAREPARHERASIQNEQTLDPSASDPTTESAAAVHSFGVIPILSPEQLLDRARQGDPMPLPRRLELEKFFGFPLGKVDVFAGEDATQALDALGAEAAAYEGAIILADTHPSLSILAHEVAHIIQNENVAAPDALNSTEAEAESAAQVVAHRADQAHMADFQPLPISAALAEATPAFQTAEALMVEPDTAAPQQAEQAFRTATQSPTPETAPEPATTAPAPVEAAPAETAVETETTVLSQEAEPSAPLDEAATPALELPPAPAPGVSAEDVAAQQDALAAAQEAIASAENPEQAVQAFASAPPTLKAQQYGSLGQNISQLATQEDQAFQEAVPEFHAELNAQAEPAPELMVAAPPAGDVQLEAVPPPPAPEVELPPTPDLGEYEANDRLAGAARRLPDAGDDRAREVGNMLHGVSTTDSEISNSPGTPPAVPLEGETDPARIESQRDEAAEQSRATRDAAQSAVMTGPGPEQVQPVNIDEAYPVEGLTAPTLQPPQPVAGTDAYLQMGLPLEVQTAFDQQQQQTMQDNLSAAQGEIQTATETRDTERQTRISEAEQQATTLSQSADEQQRTQVQTAREQIQTERQTTLDAQSQAVTDMEAEVDTDRAESQRQIDERVQQDEAEIQTRYDQAEAEAQAEIDTGERDAEAERRRAEEEAEEDSWWDAVTDFIADAFEALTSVINGIIDAVRSAVNSILDAVKDFAKGLIDAAASFIKDAITAFGEVLKAAVNTLLAETFPELAAALNETIDSAVSLAHAAVDAVAEGLKAGIDALVEGLRGALNAILDAYQAAVNAALSILQAAITGDWAGLLIKVFEAVLRVAGIDPQEIYAFIGRAEETLQLIIDDPGAFVGNLVNAFVGGIQKFADNFFTHLQAGIIGWLTGSLGTAGITIPERFDLWGVLDLVRQILGLTWDRLRAKAVRLIGEQNVARLEFFASYLETLITGGWSGLWERIQQDLGTLRDTILDGIKSFLLERVIMAAITRLATMFNPVGALVQLIIAAYNFYTFIRDQLQRIAAVLQTVVNALSDIARGVIEPAALRVEQVLAGLLPLAIDLLARLLGLGNVGEEVRSIIERVQAAVDRAIDALIERVLSAFRGDGTKQGEKPAAAGDEETGEPHHLELTNAVLAIVEQTEDPEADDQTLIAKKQKAANAFIETKRGEIAAGLKFTVALENRENAESEHELDWVAVIEPNTTRTRRSEPLGAPKYTVNTKEVGRLEATLGEKSNGIAPVVPPSRHPISYVANVITIPPKDGNAAESVAKKYGAEGFTGGVNEAGSRFALVLGVNLYEDLAGKNRPRVEGGLKFAWKGFPVAVIAVIWRPVWVNSANAAQPFTTLQDLYGKMPEAEKKALDAEEQKAKEQTVVPYGPLREIVTKSALTQAFVEQLKAHSDEVFIHVGDADSVSMHAPPGKAMTLPNQQIASALFARYDAILEENRSSEGELPLIASGGYEFRLVSENGDVPADDQLTALASELDMAIRQAMAAINPRTVYFPEPNTIFRVETESKLKTLVGSFGGGSQEGQAIVDSIVKNTHSGEARLLFDQRAAIATESTRFSIGSKSSGTLKITKAKLAAITAAHIQAVFEQAQSHALSRTWDARIASTYKSIDPAHQPQALQRLRKIYFPNEAIGYDPALLKSQLPSFSPSVNFENPTGLSPADQDLFLVLAEEEHRSLDVVRIAKTTGTAIRDFLKKLLGI